LRTQFFRSCNLQAAAGIPSCYDVSQAVLLTLFLISVFSLL
jgi:hypothetical protein